jgi:cysteine desulfurase
VIYLDHNATNLVDPRLLQAYLRGLEEGWANPSSPHEPGRRARALVEEAREQVAALAGVGPAGVTFTASGTEALNQVLQAVSGRVVASAVEHPSVLKPLEERAAAGAIELALAPVDRNGRVRCDALEALVPGAALVAVTAAQNEVGTVQPLAEVGAICRALELPLLVDATQAAGRLAVDWAHTPWDYLVLSAHKMRAPRGAGALVHRGLATPPTPLIVGGPQELGRRAGTEAVAAVVALGEACRLAAQGSLCDPAALLTQRRWLEDTLRARIQGADIVAQAAERLPQTVMVLIPGADAEALLAGLDLRGVAASSGSACASGAMERSRALTAMGVDDARAAGRLRLSFGPETTREELERAVDALVEVVEV